MDNKLSETGKSWGLTTVTRPGAKRSMSRAAICLGIKRLYNYAKDNPDKEFLIAYTSNSRNLNGYSSKEIKQMFFFTTSIPDNIIFEEDFVKL